LKILTNYCSHRWLIFSNFAEEKINLTMRYLRNIQALLTFVTLTLICYVTASAFSANDIRFRVLQTQDGLSNNDVNCIFKDSHGMMWIGTASGLNRYDGYSVKIFLSLRSDSTSLRDNYVQNIQEDSSGNLWICAGDTYSIYDPKTEIFTWFSDKQAKEYGLPDEPEKIYMDNGCYWFVVYRKHLFFKNANAPTVEISAASSAHNITDLRISRTSDNLNIVNSRGELTILTSDGRKIKKQTVVPRTVSSDEDFSIFIDSDGIIWVYSVLGADSYNPNTDRWNENRSQGNYRHVSVKSISEDENGRIWIGTDNYGIYLVEKDGMVFNLRNNPADIYSLPNNIVKTIYNSEDNGIWIGTYKKGVSVFYPSEYKFSSHLIADVNCIVRNPDYYSSVWLGTDHDGLIKYNYLSNEVQHVTDPAETDCHPITSLAIDSHGNLWIGTYQGGLKRYRNGQFTHWTIKDGLASNNIWAILVNSDGKIWLGTLGGGLQLFDVEQGTFTTFNCANSSLKSDYINTLDKSKDGAILIGTTHGIARLSPSDNSIKHYGVSSKSSNGFANMNINQVVSDSRGLVWVATREGLKVYDVKSDSLYNIRLSESFPNPFILGIVEGADRSMWVTVGNEIYNISVNRHEGKHYDFEVKTYGSHDGIISGTFNQRSMCLLQSGELLAGSMEGVVTVNPLKIEVNSFKPKVTLTGISIKNVPVEIGAEYDGRIILPVAPEYADKIKLAYNHNDITVYFSTDNYSNSDRTTYKYKLDGLDDDWIICPPGMHHATFTNLTPGRYTLHILATNFDGFESQEERTIKIIIEAPWWVTWWAQLLYLIIGLCAIVFTVRHFHKRSINRLRQQQTEELAKKTEELNQMKFKFFTNISHELRTPLTLILSPVESMLKENHDERNQRRLNTVKANASRLLYLVNQLLDFRKNEMAGLELHLSEGDLVSTIRNACESFTEIADKKDINLEFISDVQTLDMSYDNDKFTKILLNLLSNAVKYTGDGGKIEVRLERHDNTVKVAVADNGKGISDVDKAHIFERFYRSSDKSDLTTGTGIGLSLVYEYAKLHGGLVDVSDNKPAGTIFTVSIPFRESSKQTVKSEDTEVEKTDAKVTVDENPNIEDKKAHVLFIDDNHDLIEFLKDEFEPVYDITTAFNGVEALEKLKEDTFDLIVTDLMMPEMDGIELSRKIKSDSKTVDIPLIMLTAKQDMGSIIEGLTLGADDYITKPFNNEILALKMARLVRLREKGFKRSLIDPTPSQIEITPLDQQLVEKAVKYVEENISRSDLSVEELAQNMGMSRVHLYKKLSALTGKSPIEFIRLLRLKRATQYLVESQLTIAEIAYKLGFNNPKYFSKYFKDEFGMLPSEYQNKTVE